MTTAIIIHTIQEAEHCIRTGLAGDALLFSTDAAVDVYLRERHDVDCRCLSLFISTAEAFARKEAVTPAVNGLLADLDAAIAPGINLQIGQSMRFFIPLYSYMGKYHYSGYDLFRRSVEAMAVAHRVTRLRLFDRRFTDFFSCSTTLGGIASILFPDKKIDILTLSPEQRTPVVFPAMRSIIRRITQRPRGTLRSLYTRVFDSIRFRRFTSKRKTVLIYEGLFDLDFLKQRLADFNVIHYQYDAMSPTGQAAPAPDASVHADWTRVEDAVNTLDPVLRTFAADIREDFSRHLPRYIATIRHLDMLLRQRPISLGIWGNPPVEGSKALVFEYLRSHGVTVLGAQHGCIYGDSYEPWHFDSDFKRCDYFISYGFTARDLGRLYPGRPIPTEIVPLGAVAHTVKKQQKRKIDILFPITNSVSIFAGGMTRELPHELTKHQIRILEHLNKLDGLDVVVKPFMFAQQDNRLATSPVIRRCSHLKVVDNVTLIEFLERFTPRVVVIEYPSQPLFDVLPLDTEIFLLADPLHPYEAQALTELKLRVHYFENIDPLIDSLARFVQGALEPKRDATFLQHYISKEETEARIIELVNDLASGRSRKTSGAA